MSKIINFAAVAAFAASTFAIADTASAKGDYDYKEPLGLYFEYKDPKTYKNVQICKFYPDKEEKDKKYETKYAKVDYDGKSGNFKLTCYFKVPYKPAYDEIEEKFKCVFVKIDHRKKYIVSTDKSKWELDTYGKGKLTCHFLKNKDDKGY
jgi:hypothetical protein